MRNTLLALTALSLTACTASDLQTGVSPDSTGSTSSQTAAPACDSAALPFGGGFGSPSDPYLICSQAQLRSLASGPYIYSTGKLEADINMGATNLQPTAALGNFYGTLDGNGHIIGGLKTTTGYGLFDELHGTVKNVTLQFMTITCPGSGCGVLAGTLESGAVVDNVQIHDSSVSGYQSVGGALGTVYGSATGVYVWSTTITAGSLNKGGLAGQVVTGGILTGNSASGAYNAGQHYGFVVGTLQGTLTCLSPAGRTWAQAYAVAFNAGGTATGCP